MNVLNRAYAAIRDLDYDPVRNWTQGFTDETKRAYLRFLKLFCEFTGRSPSQLMRWVRRDRTAVHQKLKEFHHHMARSNFGPGNHNYAYSAIRSFFLHNDYPLGRPPRLLSSQTKIRETRLLRPVEVGDMISCARDIRSKAAISLLSQSGQRVGVLASLQYGAIRRQIEQAITPIVVDVNSERSDEGSLWPNRGKPRYRFAFGGESRDYILQMLNHRRQRGEVIGDESWLFRSTIRWDQRPGGIFYPRRYEPSEGGGPVSIDWFNTVVVRAAKAIGIQSEKSFGRSLDGKLGRFQQIHSYTFMIYWKHQMKLGGVDDPELLNYMTGLTQRYGGVYDVFDEDYVRSEYTKAEPYLTVSSRGHGKELEAPDQNKAPIKLRSVDRARPQRVVPEEDLNRFLRKGWQYITTLPSKHVLIEKMSRRDRRSFRA